MRIVYPKEITELRDSIPREYRKNIDNAPKEYQERYEIWRKKSMNMTKRYEKNCLAFNRSLNWWAVFVCTKITHDFMDFKSINL